MVLLLKVPLKASLVIYATRNNYCLVDRLQTRIKRDLCKKLHHNSLKKLPLIK